LDSYNEAALILDWPQDRLRRRDFINVVGGGLAAWPLAARAQGSARPVIGYLGAIAPNSDPHLVDAFIKGLGETGHEDGKKRNRTMAD
jgi:hypothetical protein